MFLEVLRNRLHNVSYVTTLYLIKSNRALILTQLRYSLTTYFYKSKCRNTILQKAKKVTHRK